MTRDVMERDVGHEQLHNNSLMDSLVVFFAHCQDHLSLIYIDIKQCTVYHRQRHQLGIKNMQCGCVYAYMHTMSVCLK